MSRTPAQAVALARSYAEAGWVYGRGQCLSFVDTCYDVRRGFDASEEWAATTSRGSGPEVFGALLWWTGGSKGHGHVAIALGDGTCYSTDFASDRYVGDGRVRRCFIASIAKHSSLVYRGWSYDLAGVEVVKGDWFDMATQAEVEAAVAAGVEKGLAAFYSKHWAQMVAASAGNPNTFIPNAPTDPKMHLKSDA